MSNFTGETGYGSGFPGLQSMPAGGPTPTEKAATVAASSRSDAQKVRDGFERTLTALRNNLALTADARAERIAVAWRDARDRLNELQAAEYNAAAAGIAELKTVIFRLPAPSSDPGVRLAWDSSMRDSQARYDALVDRGRGQSAQDQAIALWRRAERTGDVPMARAALVVALERGWSALWTAYEAEHPEVADALRQWADISDALNSRRFKFGRAMAFSPPSKPAEIQQMNDWKINSLFGPNAIV